MVLPELYRIGSICDLSDDAMSDDFEVNRTGTLRQLNLEDMIMRLALNYIDAITSGESVYSKESQERVRELNELRKELPDD